MFLLKTLKRLLYIQVIIKEYNRSVQWKDVHVKQAKI